MSVDRYKLYKEQILVALYPYISRSIQAIYREQILVALYHQIDIQAIHYTESRY
jgi:hypothetical protein